MHKFVLLVNGQLQTYTSWESLPDDFDHVIEFIPDIPDPPHTSEQHEEIDQWHYRLQSLVDKENKKHGNS